MERKSLPRGSLVITAIAAAILCVLALVVMPDATRLWAVSELGVLTANRLRAFYYVLGCVFGLLGVASGFLLVKQHITDRRNEAAERRERENPYRLPARTETDPHIIRDGLTRVADRHPDAQDSIDQVHEMLDSTDRDLASIEQIFAVNVGVVTDGDPMFKFAVYEELVTRIQQGMYAELVTVIYAGHTANSADYVLDAVSEYTQRNQHQAEAIHTLALETARLVPQVKDDKQLQQQASKQLKQLLQNLSSNNPRKESA